MSTTTATTFPASPAALTVNSDHPMLGSSVHTGGYSGTATRGARVRPGVLVPARDIARAIRADLKILQADGAIPGKGEGFSYSVRSDSYSGGQAVRIGIKYAGAAPSPWGGTTDEWSRRPTTPADRDGDWLTHVQREDVSALRDLLQRVGEQYTERDCDAMTDYFNVSCYITVSLG